MDDVLSFMASGIWQEYDIPENCLPYDTSEGGWQIMEPSSSWDVVSDGGWLNEDSEGFDKLFDDLVSAFSDSAFVPRNPLSLSESERLRHSWGAFCQTVKHRTRFVFFKVQPKRQSRYGYDPDDVASVPVYRILEHVERMAEEHSLVRDLPRRSVLIRARQHDSAHRPRSAEELGAPPPEKASQSRMSPAGIPMFYAAEDEKTAFLETFDPAATGKSEMTFGHFLTARKLRVLDLTRLPDLPSIFDEHRRDLRHEIIFLYDFAQDISKPIERDGREHYEYVPTQIVAEYFRSVARIGNHGVDGIAFKSSRKGASVSYCIFTDATGCSDKFRGKKAPAFAFQKMKRTVVLRKRARRQVTKCCTLFSV